MKPGRSSLGAEHSAQLTAFNLHGALTEAITLTLRLRGKFGSSPIDSLAAVQSTRSTHEIVIIVVRTKPNVRSNDLNDRAFLRFDRIRNVTEASEHEIGCVDVAGRAGVHCERSF